MANETIKPSLDPIGSLFKAAWRRCEARFPVLIQICLVPAVVIFAGDVLMAREGSVAAIFGTVLTVLGLLLSIVATVALISAVARETDFGASYDRGVKLFWPALLIAILNALAVFGGFTLFIIPGILVMVWLAFANYALVLEDKRGMNALLESKSYVQGYWWGTLGRGLLLGASFIAVMFVVYLPVALFLGPVVGGIVYGLLLLIFVPFSQCYVFEVYENLRRVRQPLSAETAKSTKIFLIILMVIAVIGTLALASLAALFGNTTSTYNYPGSSGYPGYVPPNTSSTATTTSPTPPTPTGLTDSVVPASGPVGTPVTLTVSVVLPATGDTVLMNGLVAASDVPSVDGKLTFTVPGSLGPYCAQGTACPQFRLLVRSGSYPITILPNGADPNGGTIHVGTFTVTADSTGVAQPLEY